MRLSAKIKPFKETPAVRASQIQQRQEALAAFLLLLPALVLLGTFTLYPFFRSLYLSFHEELPFIGRLEFVGLENYLDIFTGHFGASYLNSLRVTGLFTLLTVPLTIVLGLFGALLLNRSLPGIGLFRTLVFTTVAVSTAIAAIAWRWMFHAQVGYANHFLSLLGVPQLKWLTNPDTALLAVSIVTVWQSLGFTSVLILAGLRSLPEECLEAARLDGANALRRLWHVTLPLLSPTLFVVTVLAVIDSLTTFGQVHVLTRGGPGEATNLLIYNLYRDAFQNARPGFASAQAFILFVGLALITLAQFRILGRRVFYR